MKVASPGSFSRRPATPILDDAAIRQRRDRRGGRLSRRLCTSGIRERRLNGDPLLSLRPMAARGKAVRARPRRRRRARSGRPRLPGTRPPPVCLAPPAPKTTAKAKPKTRRVAARAAGAPARPGTQESTDLEALRTALKAAVAEHHPTADLAGAARVFDLAVEAHDARWVTGEPYVTHPQHVARSSRSASTRSPPRRRCFTTSPRTPSQPQRHRGALRCRSRPPRRRRDQAVAILDAWPRAAAGREHPEDAAGDGRGHPGRPHQAGRPTAQHAHARSCSKCRCRERPAAGSSSTSSSETAPMTSLPPRRELPPMLDALMTRRSTDLVPPRAGAANTAEAYGKLTGRPGICLSRAGRGRRKRLSAYTRRARLDALAAARRPGPARLGGARLSRSSYGRSVFGSTRSGRGRSTTPSVSRRHRASN